MKILITEDDKVYANALKRYLENELFFVECDVSYDYETSIQMMMENSYDLFIVDYILPNVKDGELLEKVLMLRKRVIVITNYIDKLTRDNIFSKPVSDYIIKSDFSNLEYVKSSVERLHNNKNLTILVVDDSISIRKYVVSILKLQNLNVVEAKDGKEALEILDNKKINLIITDYEMPNIDGLNLVKKIRFRYGRHDLPIIALSTINENTTISRLLKAGANDFMHKPFTKDEFLCRLNINLEIYDVFSSLHNDLVIDSLTTLYNSGFLSKNGNKIFNESKSISMMMFDIDEFLKIRKEYGNSIADEILVEFGVILKIFLREDDIIVRYKDDIFIVILKNTSVKVAFLLAEKVRKNVEQSEIVGIKFTVSGGVTDFGDSMAELIKNCDRLLSKAKNNGKNRIEIEEYV